MNLREELLIGKALDPSHELVLALMLTREHIVHLVNERLFKPEGITEPQFNVLRILTGGPREGYPLCEIRRRLITRNADVPRLVDRMVKLGLVRRIQDPADGRACRVHITARGEATEARVTPLLTKVARELGEACTAKEMSTLVRLLDRIRAAARQQSEQP